MHMLLRVLHISEKPASVSCDGLPICFIVYQAVVEGGRPWDSHECPWAPTGPHEVPRAPTWDLVGFHGLPRGTSWTPTASHVGARGIPRDNARDPTGARGISGAIPLEKRGILWYTSLNLPWEPARKPSWGPSYLSNYDLIRCTGSLI